ncbi:hypothetical protein [Bacillus sp. EB01]|uniref:hypothetical protein n=1 Tax=Bacillus sp. EB01 TaxID=1347086 RepID=UPI0006936F5C|nr:hypothetical protein [Bacillus sp. EB01]
MASFFFALSALSIVGCLYFGISYAKGGMYPPRQLLKKKTAGMAAGAAVFLLMGTVVWLAQR